VPRLQEAATVDFQSEYQVSEDELLKIIAILRLAVPYTGMIISTRERPEIRQKAFELGISQTSAGSRVEVGGFKDIKEKTAKTNGQFVTHDGRSLDQIVKSLCGQNLLPSFCTACYRLGRTGEDFMTFAKPGNIQNYVSLRMTYLISKQYDKAWATIEAGMKIDQKSALLLNLAGEACKCLGRYEDAIGFWDKSYCLDNEMPDNLFSKAYLYQETDQKEKAAGVWKEIIQWHEQRGFTVEAQSIKDELARSNNNKKQI
jgi:tetratricopeptide (TPR) repeat protein